VSGQRFDEQQEWIQGEPDDSPGEPPVLDEDLFDEPDDETTSSPDGESE
jgi:hypothetical protein